MSGRSSVAKTYKLLVGGAFVRSESGRSIRSDAVGANVPWASRKDLRDAVKAARAAWPGWAGRTGYNRAQILYRTAEMLEARAQSLAPVLAAEGAADAALETGLACDRLVHYAGWCDKHEQILGSVNPVSGPFFGFSVPEPMGVVVCVVGQGAPLLAWVTQVAPALAAGNACVVLAADDAAATACELGEVVATSDVPAGVVNILTGRQAELVPHAAGHYEVAALQSVGPVLDDAGREAAAASVKRIVAMPPGPWDSPAMQGLGWIEALVETKSVWHPVGV
jgi:acyl-CoA reductase-like NAD-dependent aldehyde dehydrogenase